MHSTGMERWLAVTAQKRRQYSAAQDSDAHLLASGGGLGGRRLLLLPPHLLQAPGQLALLAPALEGRLHALPRRNLRHNLGRQRLAGQGRRPRRKFFVRQRRLGRRLRLQAARQPWQTRGQQHRPAGVGVKGRAASGWRQRQQDGRRRQDGRRWPERFGPLPNTSGDSSDELPTCWCPPSCSWAPNDLSAEHWALTTCCQRLQVSCRMWRGTGSPERALRARRRSTAGPMTAGAGARNVRCLELGEACDHPIAAQDVPPGGNEPARAGRQPPAGGRSGADRAAPGVGSGQRGIPGLGRALRVCEPPMGAAVMRRWGSPRRPGCADGAAMAVQCAIAGGPAQCGPPPSRRRRRCHPASPAPAPPSPCRRSRQLQSQWLTVALRNYSDYDINARTCACWLGWLCAVRWRSERRGSGMLVRHSPLQPAVFKHDRTTLVLFAVLITDRAAGCQAEKVLLSRADSAGCCDGRPDARRTPGSPCTAASRI